MNYLCLLALLAGAAIATQAGMNAQLGMLLDNSLLGTAIVFACSCLFSLGAFWAFSNTYPTLENVRAVPIYLWFGGGAISAFGVALFYYLIPKMGIGSMMSYALTGQILLAVTANHFGWFEMPVKPINLLKFTGVLALVIGVLFINWE